MRLSLLKLRIRFFFLKIALVIHVYKYQYYNHFDKNYIYFFSLKFLHGIKKHILNYSISSITKYRIATKKDSSTSEVTSTQEVPIPSNNGGSDGVALLITGHKWNG